MLWCTPSCSAYLSITLLCSAFSMSQHLYLVRRGCRSFSSYSQNTLQANLLSFSVPSSFPERYIDESLPNSLLSPGLCLYLIYMLSLAGISGGVFLLFVWLCMVCLWFFISRTVMIFILLWVFLLLRFQEITVVFLLYVGFTLGVKPDYVKSRVLCSSRTFVHSCRALPYFCSGGGLSGTFFLSR